jgi:hypothetical protein
LQVDHLEILAHTVTQSERISKLHEEGMPVPALDQLCLMPFLLSISPIPETRKKIIEKRI